MKRTFIAGAGVAVLGIGALPWTGVFAAENEVVDTIRVTVGETCQLLNEGAEGTINWETGFAGQEYEVVNGTDIKITCNNGKRWTLKATASDLVNAVNRFYKIPFGKYSKGGESVWSAEVSLTGDGTIENGWNSFTADKGANGGTIVSSDAIGEVTVSPKYKAYVGEGQASGFYQGTIYYTFSAAE